MLTSILKVNGIAKLEKEMQKNINGGVSTLGICHKAGDSCCAGGFLVIPCLGSAAQIECVSGVWTEI